MSERVILTGFEPFGPYKYNPVYDTTLKLNRQSFDGLEVYGIILPSSYYKASEILLEKIKEISPSVVLSTGLFSSIPKIRFETVGQNKMDGKYPDNEGKNPNGEKLITEGKDFYKTNVDNLNLVYSLNNVGIAAEISVNADYFICNSLIYLTERNIERENLKVKFGFFHTPWTDAYINLVDIAPEKTIISQENLERAIKISLVEMRK